MLNRVNGLAEGWKELPDEEGDWLWVEMWGCGCCVSGCGICWVTEYDVEFKDDDYYKNVFVLPGEKLCIHWEPNSKYIPGNKDGKVWVHGFLKVELPYVKDD